MKEIQLTQGKVALVDDEDFAMIAKHKWFAARHCRTFYAGRNVCRPDGKWTTEDMHRVILACKLDRALAKGEQTDHENGNGLDNQRENLRPATNAQNGRNCRRRNGSPSSQYLGVQWNKWAKKWRAQIRISNKPFHLGYYPTELSAAQARETYVLAHPELMARLNFPPNQ